MERRLRLHRTPKRGKGLFIIWSGDTSRDVAQHFDRWIKKVFPEFNPFFSEDLERGKPWFEELCKELSARKSAIAVVTKDNAKEPWISFEAGAIGCKPEGKVAVILFGASPDDLKGTPLEHFQYTLWKKAEILRLFTQLGSDAGMNKAEVKQKFDRKWSLLRKNVKLALEGPQSAKTRHKQWPTSAKHRELLKKAKERQALLKEHSDKNYRPVDGFTRKPDSWEYKLMREAEEENRNWPLEVGETVFIQGWCDDGGNGEVGTVISIPNNHHRLVRYSRNGGTTEKRYHVMYLTRVDSGLE